MPRFYHELSYSGYFLGFVFAIGSLIQLILGIAFHDYNFLELALKPPLLSCYVTIILMLLSARWRRLAILQPLFLLLVLPIPLFESYTSFYSLGSYVCAIILFHKGGFLKKRRVVKIILLLAYLYVVEIAAILHSTGDIVFALSPVFVVSAFLAFLYLSFKDKVIVYLEEAKPRLSLSACGLSAMEQAYVQRLIVGDTMKEIAYNAGISESTVRNSLSRVYKKLKVADKTALIAYLSRFNLEN